MSGMCGGTGPIKEANEEINALCEELKPHIETKSGRNFGVFEVKSYTSQVVAGTNYFIKIHVGEDEHIHVKVFKALPCNGGKASVKDVVGGKTEHEPIGFF